MVSPTGAVPLPKQNNALFHGTSDFGYDANGRRLWSRRLDGTTYDVQCLEYDMLGALLEVRHRTAGSNTESDPCDHAGPWTEVAYGVDVTGRRVTRDDGTTQTAWLYQDALNPVAQLDEENRLQQVYVYATRGHVPDAIQVFNPVTGDQTATWAVISDLRGSVRAVVDVATGTVVQRLSYDAWGVVVHDSAPGTQPFGYAGGLYDHATGLVRYGARDYDPLVGRWTAPDPIGFGGGDTNLYAYVGGDPVNFVDPTGLVNITYIDMSSGGQSSIWQTMNRLWGPDARVVHGMAGDSMLDLVARIVAVADGEPIDVLRFVAHGDTGAAHLVGGNEFSEADTSLYPHPDANWIRPLSLLRGFFSTNGEVVFLTCQTDAADSGPQSAQQVADLLGVPVTMATGDLFFQINRPTQRITRSPQ